MKGYFSQPVRDQLLAAIGLQLLGACRTIGIETFSKSGVAKFDPSVDSMCRICRPIAPLLVKKTVKIVRCGQIAVDSPTDSSALNRVGFESIGFDHFCLILGSRLFACEPCTLACKVGLSAQTSNAATTSAIGGSAPGCRPLQPS